MDEKAIYWIKYFKSDLISSLSYKSLPVYNKGIFNILFTLCRDLEYAGEFCSENGKPMSIDEIIPNMDLQKGDRADRIKSAIQHMVDVGMIFQNWRGCLEIRKYAKKTGQEHLKKRPPGTTPPPPGSPEVGQGLSEATPEVAQGLSAGSPEVVKPPDDIQGLTEESETTEQKQTTENISKYITDNELVVNDETNYFYSLELLSFVGVEVPVRDKLARDHSIRRVVQVIKWAIKKAETNKSGAKPVRSLSALVITALEKNWRI